MAPYDFLERLELVWHSATGLLSVRDPQAGTALIAAGYSGKGDSVNRPEHDHLVAQGPIPRGLWALGVASRHPRLGSVCIPLQPISYTGERTGFFIHGDNQSANRTASLGCIILNRRTREWIAGTGIRTLAVV